MQRTHLQVIAAILLATLVSTAARAQAGSLPRTAAISGVVRDSATGRPQQKTWVCVTLPRRRSAYESRCAAADMLGAYRLDSLPAVGMLVSVACEEIHGLGKGLASDTIVFVDSVVIHRDWIVQTAGCDPRPVRRVVGVFRGHYTSGFESSDFVPCAADGWFIPGDSLDLYEPYNVRRAWVDWLPGVGDHLERPDVPRESYGNPRYYVRWRGTVVGPGRYGHMAASLFEFTVDSVLERRAPAPQDCAQSP